MTTDPQPPNQTIEVPPRKWYTHSHMKPISIVFFVSGFLMVLWVGTLGVGGYFGYKIWKNQQQLSTDVTQLNEKVEVVSVAFDSQLRALAENVSLTQSENTELSQRLEEEQDKVARTLERELERVTDTVGDLEKLSKTDPELLQKYSKVSFLNEHYTPLSLKEIPEKYRYDENQTLRIHDDVWPFLEDLLEEAEDDDIELFVKSGYRSFNEQGVVKSAHTVVYGAGTANTFSADQGYSEHQLGTTIDFITTGIGGTLDGFGDTPAYQWLLDNAYKYGFILSYPEGNEYYVYEPWHWRFVGRSLARKLDRGNDNFYDLDQREIDEYLIKLFD